MDRDEDLRQRSYSGDMPPPPPEGALGDADRTTDDVQVTDIPHVRDDEERVTHVTSDDDVPVDGDREDVYVQRDVHVERHDHDHRDAGEGIAVARDRFGGFDIPAQLTGMLVALAMLVLLGGIAGAAIGTIAYQTGVENNLDELSIGSLITGIVVLFLAFLIGGWAAGRIARYDGGRNGLMTAVWFIILGALLAGLGIWLGAEYNVVGRVELPNWFDSWFSQDEVTTAAAISGIVAIVVTLIGGFIGGLWGVRLHRRADDLIARTASEDDDDTTTTRTQRVVDDRDDRVRS